MSTILTLQYENIMFVGYDIALAMSVNPQTKELKAVSQRVFAVDDMIIYFSGGRGFLLDNLMGDFLVHTERSVKLLCELLVQYFGDWSKTNPDNLQDGLVEAIVATTENGKAILYCISPYNQFQPFKRVVEQGQCSVISVGEKSKETTELALSLAAQNVPAFLLFPRVYQTLIGSGAGGALTVHQIDQYGTVLYQRIPIIHGTDDIKMIERTSLIH